MKYAELIDSQPLPARIQLREAEGYATARRFVEQFVVSRESAQLFREQAIPWLEGGSGNQPGGLVLTGGVGIGKTHWLAVISALAEHADLAGHLSHAGLATAASSFAGKYKVLRLEPSASSTNPRLSAVGQLESGLAAIGVTFSWSVGGSAPPAGEVWERLMKAFQSRYPEHRLLIVVDEWNSGAGALGKLRIARDREFWSAVSAGSFPGGLRFLAGLSSAASHEKNRPAPPETFARLEIPANILKLVLAQRLVRKTSAQRDWIRQHLSRWISQYESLQARMEEFVDLFPVHPDFLDVAGKVKQTHPRDVWASLSAAVDRIRHENVPEDHPGLIACDEFWEMLRQRPELRIHAEVEAVCEYNELIAGKVRPAFRDAASLALANRLIHALSVHRLTTRDVYSHEGPTAAELREMLMPGILPGSAPAANPAEVLLEQIVTLLGVLVRETVREQYVACDAERNRYYLHLRDFKRFVKPELALHWINAIPFLFLLVSGGSMFVSHLLRPDSEWIVTLVKLHKICAGAWLFLVPLTVLLNPKVHWRHIRPMLRWGGDDLVWMVQTARSLIDRKAVVPAAGRFNTGQKMNACLVMMYYFTFGATGLTMVLRGPILLPWYIHTGLFVLAAGSVSGHLFLALINPSTRIALAGIFHGWSPMKYVEHHHRLSLPESRLGKADHAGGHVTLRMVGEWFLLHRTKIILLVLGAATGSTLVLMFSRPTVASVNRRVTWSFTQSVAPRSLSPKHRHGKTGESCTTCHTLTGGIPDSRCEHCHAEVAQRRIAQAGYHGTLKGQCVECHKEHPGPSRQIVKFDRQKFDHSQASFKRDGKHAQVDCDDCHVKKRPITAAPGYYLGLKHDTCTACHEDQHRGELGGDCAKCHRTQGWRGEALQFVHDRDARFSLQGQHQKVSCVKCHQPGRQTDSLRGAVFKGLSSRCVDCHQDPHHMQFASDCQSCHTPEGWRQPQLKFEHNRDARFRLQDKHTEVACEKCHVPARPGNPLGLAAFRGLKTDCADCHQDPHQGQFARDCQRCHQTPVGWPVARQQFRHDRDTKYPLVEKHASVDCIQCHRPAQPGGTLASAKFRHLSTDCADCHQDPHGGQFERRCTSCHQTPAGWPEARKRFDHERNTHFPLRGKHAAVDCRKCHRPPRPEGPLSAARFKGTATSCEQCHEVKHPAPFGRSCASCHTEKEWPKKRPGFEHIFRIRAGEENLTGKHLGAECGRCHDGKKVGPLGANPRLNFKCVDCHQADEPHRGSLGQDCSKCHTMDGWKGNDLRFDHDTMASFALDQDHRHVACAQCHVNGKYKPLDTRCAGCHTQSFLDKRK